jgi:hypothetical protein
MQPVIFEPLHHVILSKKPTVAKLRKWWKPSNKYEVSITYFLRWLRTVKTRHINFCSSVICSPTLSFFNTLKNDILEMKKNEKENYNRICCFIETSFKNFLRLEVFIPFVNSILVCKSTLNHAYLCTTWLKQGSRKNKFTESTKGGKSPHSKCDKNSDCGSSIYLLIQFGDQ